MSKTIVLNMWCSIVPDTMYSSWVKRKFIKRGACHISEAKEELVGTYVDCLEKEGEKSWKNAYTSAETKALKADGWRLVYHTYCVNDMQMSTIHSEIQAWYKEVFAYVKKWLTDKKFISLKKGSFDGGFCATGREDETTKAWGAPLANEENKVCQIKEKFGYVTVYFTALTKEERAKVNAFAKHVEDKFDCACSFC